MLLALPLLPLLLLVPRLLLLLLGYLLLLSLGLYLLLPLGLLGALLLLHELLLLLALELLLAPLLRLLLHALLLLLLAIGYGLRRRLSLLLLRALGDGFLRRLLLLLLKRCLSGPVLGVLVCVGLQAALLALFAAQLFRSFREIAFTVVARPGDRGRCRGFIARGLEGRLLNFRRPRLGIYRGRAGAAPARGKFAGRIRRGLA